MRENVLARFEVRARTSHQVLDGSRRPPEESIRPPSADITCWTLTSFSATLSSSRPPPPPSTTTSVHTLWILTSHMKEAAPLTAEIPLTLQSTWSLTKVQTKRSECSRGTLFIIFPAPVSPSINLLKYLICGRLFLCMLGFVFFFVFTPTCTGNLTCQMEWSPPDLPDLLQTSAWEKAAFKTSSCLRGTQNEVQHRCVVDQSFQGWTLAEAGQD